MNAIPDYFVRPAANILSTEQLDALGWTDLPVEPASAPAVANDPAADPLFIGCVDAHQRGVSGPITLEVLLDADERTLEIGPFRLDRREAVALFRLLLVARALLAHPERLPPRPESGRGIAGWDLAARPGDRPVTPTMTRNPTGRADCPPWEGETLP